MIRVIIQAGFGNQLFQYATAYALGKEKGQAVELDISFFDYVKNRKMSHARVNNLDKLALDTPKFVNKPRNYWKYRLREKMKFIQSISIGGKRVPFICENFSMCREDQSGLFRKIGEKGAVIHGFWQNTEYFKEYLLDLKKQFVPNYVLDCEVIKVLQQIQTMNSVGVHIRRGDFVTLGWDKGRDYYDRGMEWFKREVASCKFYIVSDDPEWVTQQYGERKDIVIIDVSTQTKDIDEFFLLASCRHQLISESTFGWWAAFLNTNEQKKVVVPKEAVGEMFQAEWHRL